MHSRGMLMAKVRTLRVEIFQECTLVLRVLKESAQMFSVVCTEYSGPAPRCALLFVRSAQVFGRPVHFASSVHSFLLPSAPQFRLRARLPVLAGGPGSGGVGGGSGDDSFPVNPGVAALWHPRAAAAAATTVKVVTGGGQFEERPAP